MASNIKFKRSAVQNRVPTTSQLDLGELALNTYDGKLYTEINTGSAAVVEIGSKLSSLVVDGANGAGGGDVVFHGTTSGRDLTWDYSADSLIFNDNAKAKFGTGGDLEVYHNGTNSHLKVTNGALVLNADQLYIQSLTENYLTATANGAVDLYHNNLLRISTTADGADIGGTGSLKIPVGTTAQRSGSPTAGDLRYNTTTGGFEGYSTSWGELGGGGIGVGSDATNPRTGIIQNRVGVGFTDINIVGAGISVTGYGTTVFVDFNEFNPGSFHRTIHNYTATAGQTTFAGLNYVSSAKQIAVYLNGARQSEATYTATSGTTVVLDVGASVGDEVEIINIHTNSDVDRKVNTYTATAGQTTFTGLSYNSKQELDVYLNGIRLASGDFTATSGSTVVLAVGASVNDIVDIVSTGDGISFRSTADASGDRFTLNNLGIGTDQTPDKLNVRGNVNVVGVLTATTLHGDGSNLTGLSLQGTGEAFVNLRNSSNPPALSDTGRNIIIGVGAAHKYGNGSASGGNENLFAGYAAGYTQTSGDGNVFLGAVAGYSNATSGGNTYIGHEAGRFATGANNVILGRYAGNVGGFTGSNNIVIGNNSDPSAANISNEITLGDTNITKFRIPGINFILKDNGGTPTTGHILTVDGSGEAGFAAASVGGASSITFNDDVGLFFGAGNSNGRDLQIVHEPSASVTSFKLEGHDAQFCKLANNNKVARFSSTGVAYLYYNNSLRLETTSTGITLPTTVLLSSSNRLNFRDANAAIYDQSGQLRLDRAAGDIRLKSNSSGGDSGDVILNGGSIGDLLRAHGTGQVSIINQLNVGAGVSVVGVSTFTGNANFSSGADVTGNMTVSGNMTVGGVLTYDDVTNIDSVGIVTVRSGGYLDVRTGSSINTNATGSGASGTLHKNTTSGEFAVVSGGTGGNNYLTFYTSASSAPTEKLRIGSDGQATFDKGAPGSSNQVLARFQAESSRRLDIVWHDSGSLMGFNTPGNHSYIFKCNDSEKLRITSAGRIGIGEVTPDALLHISGGSADAQIRLQRTNAASNTNDYGRIYFESTNNVLTGQIAVARESAENDGYMHFKTATGGTLSERLRITGSGALGTNSIVRSAYGGLDLCSQGATNNGTLTLGAGGGQNGQSRNNNQENQFRIMMPTYANPSNMATVMYGTSGSAGHDLFYGGGTGWAYAVNTHRFFTTANQTTGTGTERLRITSGGNLNVGGDYAQTTYKLKVTGSFAATTKSFVIDHPTKENHSLRYACLEGPENSVYVRGRSSDPVIELPDYWVGLVHEDSITVNVTPIGNKNVWVESINNNSVTIGTDGSTEYFYTVFAERKDVEKLEVEVQK